MFPAFCRFYHSFFTELFNKIKAHVRKRCLTVQAPIFFHDMYQLTKDLFFPFRQSQTFFDERIFLHDLCSCKTHRESCFFCIGFDQMNGCMDTSVKCAYRILRWLIVRTEINSSRCFSISCNMNRMIDQLIDSLILYCWDWNNRYTQDLLQLIDPDRASICPYLIHHI